MKYIDLYAGIGGFRLALDSYGNECVFSAEIDKSAIETYKENYGDDSFFDMDSLREKSNEEIRKIIPKHELLVGGFPCQPFSKAGERKGFETSDTKGTQFFNILKIIDAHNPKHVFLENVRNFTSHDSGNTWKVVKSNLLERGYNVINEPLVLSPISFGVPQNRERVFIIASKTFDPNKIDTKNLKQDKGIYKNIINKNTKINEEVIIKSEKLKAIKAWGEFAKKIKTTNSQQIPVIWIDEMLKPLNTNNLPEWKIKMILKMKELYKNNKEFIDKWMAKHNCLNFPRGLRKMEWQSSDNRDYKKTIITFRPSGVRFKSLPIFPTLVAMVQVPMIWDNENKMFRKLSVREVSKLQSFPDKFKLNKNPQQALKQFGNSVNVDVIKGIYNEFFK